MLFSSGVCLFHPTKPRHAPLPLQHAPVMPSNVNAPSAQHPAASTQHPRSIRAASALERSRDVVEWPSEADVLHRLTSARGIREYGKNQMGVADLEHALRRPPALAWLQSVAEMPTRGHREVVRPRHALHLL
eukprot:CAMPEP_0179912936 /NCGR_PEP_ID=MMETSP0983-20121128/176_1 /TAXON_ID=483367 /ORGANISM="non described non described, Strain CCMP 2436" /LENGTH=131 /DNA_ID=CAMNT_0021814859 /DNA_START=744 /DNA_END=1140 /DNA_ORIENTATION=-